MGTFIVAAAMAVGALIVGVVVFLVVGWAWYAWGFVGVVLFFGALVCGSLYMNARARRRRVAA